jgi:hypothetical protein
MGGFDPRHFRPGNVHYGQQPETPEPSPTPQPESDEPPVFQTMDPYSGARRILIDACRPGTIYDEFGNRVDDEELLLQARIATHPDHRDGDRTAWDRVERAAQAMGLIPGSRTAR